MRPFLIIDAVRFNCPASIMIPHLSQVDPFCDSHCFLYMGQFLFNL